MGLNLSYKEGQTPLNEEEKDGLRIRTITTHAELDELEHSNIEIAFVWLETSKPKKEEVLTEEFIKKLHKKMYGDVWSWAGSFRTTEKNIGNTWTEIPVKLRQLIDDTKYWIEHEIYSPEEIAIRFKHRLVSIHCFPNGNGRHSRIMAEIIMETLFGKNSFSWHQSSLVNHDENRKRYIAALKVADNGDIEPLKNFALSIR